MKRDYTTWEEDLCSDRAELHGYDEELIAVIDQIGTGKRKEWILYNRDGKEVCRRVHKEDVMRLAGQLVSQEGEIK